MLVTAAEQRAEQQLASGAEQRLCCDQCDLVQPVTHHTLAGDTASGHCTDQDSYQQSAASSCAVARLGWASCTVLVSSQPNPTLTTSFLNNHLAFTGPRLETNIAN